MERFDGCELFIGGEECVEMGWEVGHGGAFWLGVVSHHKVV